LQRFNRLSTTENLHERSQVTDSFLAISSLLPVATQSVGDESAQTVNARELHAFLQNGDHFATWIKDRIEQYGFADGRDFAVVDYSILRNQTPVRGGDRRSKEYALTLDTAKQLAMVERNEKGKQARLYFIECEKQSKKSTLPQTPEEMLHWATGQLALYAAKQLALETKIALDGPKVAFAEAAAASRGDFGLMAFAKEAGRVLNIGPRAVLKRLRDQDVFYYLGGCLVPFQPFIDKGFCKVTEVLCPDNQTRPQTVITPSGRQKLFRMLEISDAQISALEDQHRIQTKVGSHA
jgi:anti-repressor protein